MKNIKVEEINYWVFQGNPKVYNVEGAIKDRILKTWSVKTHKEVIKIGDKVILWVTGNKAGCYALAEVTSEIIERKDDESEIEYYLDSRFNEVSSRVSIKITHDLTSHPILKEQIQDLNEFISFKGGSQGTNFKSSKKEYDYILQLIDNKGIKLDLSLDNDTIIPIIKRFVEQAKTNDLKTSTYPKHFNKFKLKISFGQGVPARIPWIGILKSPNTISRGIYPGFLFYKEINKLVLAYGISETDETQFKWLNTQNLKAIKDWYLKEYNKSPDRYGSSYIKSIYDLNKEIDFNLIDLELREIIAEYELIEFENNGNNYNIEQMPTSLNQILYGPPGTGKTYTTIDKVVEICEPNLFSKNHKSNKEIYDNLIEDGRVVFTTFHQSMSYEDFIEGIKPVKPEDDDIYLKYDVEPGILRNIASNAKKIKISKNSVNWDSPRYFKMSIGGKNRLDLHDWCIENSTIALGWGGNKDLSDFSKIKDWKTYRDEFNSAFPELVQESRYNIQSTYSFLQMDINDIVIISKGNNIIDAIGIVKGEYFFNDDNAIDYNHFRKVEWISTNMAASPEKFLKKKISQQSIYEFYSQDIKKDVLKELTSNIDEIAKPYVLVIDEINRGNVSAIFGELITLIEEDKRIGAENELSVTLPYSKIKFGIPPNLYIIGTMNTADRSVEALDTALRRRFTFEEMLPKPELLKDKGENKSGHVGAINLEELLITINDRIEALVDRDHTIGHAFFMAVDSMTSLRKVFTNKVIPLLQEYFYGDYAKMEMVIGPNFFNQDKRKSKVMFAVQNDEVEITTGSYQLITIADDTEFEEALKRLLASK